MLAVWSGSIVGLTTASAPIVAVPVLPPPTRSPTPATPPRCRAGRRARAACRWPRASPAAAGSGRSRSAAACRASMREAIDRVAARDAAHQPVGAPRQLVAPESPGRSAGRIRSPAAATASAIASVTPAEEVADAVARVARRRQRLRRADRRTAARRRPAALPQVEAERLLLVQAARERRRQLAEPGARVDEVFVLEAQQAGDRAAAQQCRRQRRAPSPPSTIAERERASGRSGSAHHSPARWPGRRAPGAGRRRRTLPTVPSSAATVVTWT